MTDDPTRPDDELDTEAEAPSPPTQSMQSMPDELAPGVPRRVGQYRIKRAIASGGMGTVYEALQERPRRTVAVKFMRAGIASPSALRRFEYEAQLLARLRHPGIAQIYEAGTHREGDATVPYFAMEYIVAGKSITDYVREKKLGTRERIKLFITVCEAVHHGHQKGIIHRDLKPSNILVDSSGQVKVIDFGVARSTDSDMAVTTLQTDVGALLGTLQYMSPEQCAADPHDIDTRSDVYTLGVILYEILTGRPPYEVKATALHEATRIIREQQPTRPSSIDRALRGDLETIALTALEKDRDRRYQSASALTADLKRYLNNEAISARPPSMAYQLKVFARRNKGVFAAAAAIFAVLLVGAVVSTTLYFRAEAARAEAATRAAELEQVATFQEQQLTGIDVPLMGIRLRQGLLDKAKTAAERSGEEGDARVGQLEQQLAGVDFTGLSLRLLDENIFTPARETIDEQFESQPLVRARLLQALARTLRDQGLLEQATAPQEQALSIRRAELGEEHPDTLYSIHQTAILLNYQGHLEEAERQIRLAVDGYRRILTENATETYQGVNDLGIVVANRARFEEAEGHFREALDGALRTAGKDHDTTLEAYNNVGWILVQSGKLEEAEAYYRESLEGNRRLHGDNHRNTLTAMSNLSGWLRKTGRLDEGVQLQREAVEGMRQALGDLNPLTLTVIHNLGHALEAAGKKEEAAAVFLESYEGNRAVLGGDHRQTVKSAGCYGDLLNGMGKPEAAEPYVRARMEGYRRILGAENPESLVAVNNMAYTLNKLDRYRETVALIQANLPAARQAWAEKDTGKLGNYLVKLGEAQVGLGRYSAAEATLLEANERLVAGFGAEHPLTVNSARQLVELYGDWGAAQPGKGYEAKAAEWRAKLPDR